MSVFTSSTINVGSEPDGSYELRLDVPGRSLNVIDRQVLADLGAALAVLEKLPRLPVLVVRSGKKSGFVAGADLAEFAALPGEAEARAISAEGQALFGRLANLKGPSVAVVHGPCLGGGLELALACDYRLVMDRPDTQLGLPEVELGLLPGWGGTVRLPRVVGLERALQVILSGKRLGAAEALAWGLADEIAKTEEDLRERFARLLFRAVAQGKRRRDWLPYVTWRQRLLEGNFIGRGLVFRGTERLLRQRVPDDMPAPLEAMEAVRTGLSGGPVAGFAAEREAAARL
ncbi:MAG: enoyl-CoA hydratase/isomerase family protein, partial [Gemmataceae bacterium]|nr:enoyl-CoA hydratase/isomerase family protein [Gemmataceae bacterium]